MPSSPQVDDLTPPVYFQSQAAAAMVDMPPVPVGNSVAYEGELVEDTEAAGGLPHTQPATQQWVRPRMQYKFITAAML